MPKFMTYQRPAAVDKSSWQGKQPGVAHGKPGKQAPKPAPESKKPVLNIQLSSLKLPRQ